MAGYSSIQVLPVDCNDHNGKITSLHETDESLAKCDVDEAQEHEKLQTCLSPKASSPCCSKTSSDACISITSEEYIQVLCKMKL